ncbi:MAG: hypothetical protein RLZZ584_2487 [Pseudomonadota bacterium]|jgi:hypothetical protein
MKVPIVRIPFVLALDVAKLLHELAQHIDTAPAGSALQGLAPTTHDLAAQMRAALFAGIGNVTEGRQTRTGVLYLEGRQQLKDWSGS